MSEGSVQTDIPGEATSIEGPVQRQLEAYNARNLERFVAEYADDVCVWRMPATAPALSGKAELAAHYASHRFNIAALHAQVVRRIVAGNKVVDHERIAGLGADIVEAVAVYEVTGGLIRNVWFFSPA